MEALDDLPIRYASGLSDNPIIPRAKIFEYHAIRSTILILNDVIHPMIDDLRLLSILSFLSAPAVGLAFRGIHHDFATKIRRHFDD